MIEFLHFFNLSYSVSYIYLSKQPVLQCCQCHPSIHIHVSADVGCLGCRVFVEEQVRLTVIND